MKSLFTLSTQIMRQSAQLNSAEITQLLRAVACLKNEAHFSLLRNFSWLFCLRLFANLNFSQISCLDENSSEHDENYRVEPYVYAHQMKEWTITFSLEVSS